MTQKDLLYMVDAVTHEQNLISLWNNYSNLIEDTKAYNLINKEIKKHEDIKEKILKVMEDISCE